MDEGLSRHDRRTFLGAAAMSLGALGAGSPIAASAAKGGPSPAASTPETGLALLKEGNARFVSGHSQCGPLTARVVELESGQAPFAIVLGCSDSRVPIETVFDQIPGNIFVVRVAGNFLTDVGLGSIEYSIAELKSTLLVVLGHTECGAVKATIEYVKEGETFPGHIQSLVTAIAPAVKAAKPAGGDWVAASVKENVRQNVAAAGTRSHIVADAVKAGKLAVVGAVYDLSSGKVDFLDH